MLLSGQYFNHRWAPGPTPIGLAAHSLEGGCVCRALGVSLMALRLWGWSHKKHELFLALRKNPPFLAFFQNVSEIGIFLQNEVKNH